MIDYKRLSKIFIITIVCQIVLSKLPLSAAADSCTTPGSTYGSDTIQLAIPTTASYTIWLRLKIPASSASSVLLNIGNNANCYNIGGNSSAPINTWEWIDYSDSNAGSTMQVSLSQGTHSFLITGLANGTQLDRVEALAETSCVPSGIGSNCLTATTTPSNPSPSTSSHGSGIGASATATSKNSAVESASIDNGSSITPTTIAAEGNGPAVSTTSAGQVEISAPVTLKTAQQSGVKKVEYLLNNKLLATKYAYPYSYTLNSRNILNGTYTLATKTFYMSGKVKLTSQKVIIKNPQSLTQDRLFLQKYSLLAIIGILILLTCIVVLTRQLLSGHFAKNKTKPNGDEADFDKAGLSTHVEPAGGIILPTDQTYPTATPPELSQPSNPEDITIHKDGTIQ
jgi:hypothetical protein